MNNTCSKDGIAIPVFFQYEQGLGGNAPRLFGLYSSITIVCTCYSWQSPAEWVCHEEEKHRHDGTLPLAVRAKDIKVALTRNDSQLIADIGPADAFYFRYNSGGDMLGYRYKAGNTETECIFVKNQQGDVERILDAGTGTVLASYTYDAWGRVLASDGDLADDNPIRYRGYYFDTETGLYYIGSRYYDPEVCRFINADDVTNLGANGDFASTNLFAYCGNNPVYRFDPEGTDWHTAFKVGVAVFLVGALVLATLPFSGPLLAGAGVAAASVSSAAYTAMAAGGIMAGESLAVGIIKQSTRDADPYRRPDQKKQGRELKSKARTKDSFKSRNNRRDGMPARPKHHTPGNDHKKYSVFVFWQKNEER